KAIIANDPEYNMNLFQMGNVSWLLGKDPDTAYEILEGKKRSVFKGFPENIIRDDDDYRENLLDNGQLDLVISNNAIIIDWVNPNGDEEDLKIEGPVTFRKVLEAINQSLRKFAQDNNEDYYDLISHGHIFFEGLSLNSTKDGYKHYIALFGS
ncbi:MAG: hypothetical protein WD512_09795, partial [Candidatus Paceibacterota bacterium]